MSKPTDALLASPSLQLLPLLGSLLLAPPLAAQTTVLEADFDSSTPVSAEVTANATSANLDAGTSTGSWTVGGSPPGAIISDGNGNHAFVFDRATAGVRPNEAVANFSESVDLANKALSLEMDLYAVRQAGGQIVNFFLEDAAGNVAYKFAFQMNNTKRVFATLPSGSGTANTSNTLGTNNGFKNPAVDAYLSWGGATMVKLKLDVAGTPSPTGGYEASLSVDWNGDGDYEDYGEWDELEIGPEGYDAGPLTALRIANDESLNGGAWIDHLKASTSDWQPEEEARPIFNLAKFQTTTADAEGGSWPAQFATDGFVTQDSRWVGPASGPHWLEIELAVPMTIGSMHLYSGGTWDAAMANSVLQYDNGSGWVDIAGTQLTGNTLKVQNLVFDEPVTARNFRLYTTDNIARVAELALYAPTPDGSPVPFGTDVDLNLAKMRQYVHSSLSGANYPKLATDGLANNASAWASANEAGPHDYEIHFPHIEHIGGVHLYSGFDGVSGTAIENFEIAYESEGEWIVFDGGSITGNTESDRVVRFNASARATKIRFRSLDDRRAIVRELVVLPPMPDPWFPLGTDASSEPPPTASFLDYEDSYYTIENRAEGTHLETSETGAGLTTAQPWFQVLYNLGSDSYRIRSKDSEKCFEVALASTEDGAPIIEGTYSSMPHQRWLLVPADGAYVRFVNAWSGLVLGWDGENVVQQLPDDSANQEWLINYETHFPKQGQASHFHFSHMFTPSWAYRWTYAEEYQLDHGQYMPMQWGSMGSASPGILKFQPEWYRRANQTTVMGFNEPDLEDQAHMEVSTGLYQWPRLERMRLPLLGPCPAAYKGSWRQEFEAAAEEQGLRTDYMAVHWYSPNGAPSGSPSTLIANMQYLYDTYGKKIWLTEFSTRDFAGTKTTWSRAENYNFLAEFMWRAESLPWLAKWSIFEWSLYGGNPETDDSSSSDPYAMNSPRLALHIRNDSSDPGYEDLSECGLLLAGWDGDATVRDNKAYIIHNKATKMRLIDNPDAGTIEIADLLNRVATEQFMLVSAPGGKKYIVGLSDGRRLHYDGSALGLSPAGTTGSSVEWALAEYQHGWFYINHPATETRLRITSAGALDVAPNTTTNDNTRFRFITPAQPISLTEVQPLPYAESFENGVGAWRQFEEDGYDWEVGTGTTPTAAAGPAGASDGDHYLFAEGHDSPSQGDLAQVQCTFDLSSVTNATLTFDYHMYGSFIDYLAIDIHDGSDWNTDYWLRDEQQHTASSDAWTQAVVDLAPFIGQSEVTIRFRTARKVWNAADPAIDNIVIREQPRALPYIETFEDNFGSWYQVADDDIDWTRHSGDTPTAAAGPSAASEGDWYVYFEGHDSGAQNSNSIAGLECAFDFSAATNPQLTFDYHMYGSFIDYLSVDAFDGTTWTNLWLADGQQHANNDAAWSTATVNLSAFAGLEEVAIRFSAAERVWSAADTALDHIRVEEQALSPYEIWAANALAGAPEGSDLSAGGNVDGDRYTNEEEWVLLLNPLSPDSPELVMTTEGGNLAVEFSRRTGTHLEVRAAWSSTLLADDWHYVGDGLLENVLDTLDDTERVEALLPMDSDAKFLRLEVWETGI
ncbi:MAG: glycosyl hydrolase [Verrucomicrobiota bacterium JB023]|nr:glycosyl hydrolase [Verrucomicrobiota bacterium JB023]